MVLLFLSVIDYVIIGVCCGVSIGAGLYFSQIKKQSSFFEYFLASRSVHIVPIILSFFATYISTSTLIAYPNEVYLFGTQLIPGVFMAVFSNFVASRLFIPVIHQLNTPNIYKFLELRFNSVLSRVVIVISLFQTLGTASVYLYTVSLSMSAVSALSTWAYVGIISSVVITYSAIGGMRGIILADSVQGLVMLIAILSVFVRSIVVSANWPTVWQRNWDGHRLEFFNFDVDPRTRYTVWTEIANAVYILQSKILGQQCQQRLLASSTVEQAQKASNWGIALCIIATTTTCLYGLFMYSYYYLCDPVKSGAVKSVNQIFSYYVSEIFYDIPGMTGFYFAAVVCAFLSTYSSLLNSFAAVFIDGILQPILPRLKNQRLTLIAKISVIVFGLLTIAGVQMGDVFPTLVQASNSFQMVTSGPLLFLFLIGILCPQANSKMVFSSFCLSCVIMMWVVGGACIMRIPAITKPLSIDNCPAIANVTITFQSAKILNNSTLSGTPSSSLAPYFPLSSMSFHWYAAFGFIITVIIFSVLVLIFYDQKVLSHSVKYDLIPENVKRWHLKMNRRWRKIFLSDVYDEQDKNLQQNEVEMKLTEKHVAN